MPNEGFRCSCCGEWHEGLPRSWSISAPIYWDPGDESVKTGDSELKEDLCVIRREHFFIQGNLEIPLRDDNSVFALSVWTSLSKENFTRAREMWGNPQRVTEPPYFGWLSNNVPGYPETLNLKTHVHTREVGLKPFIELEPTDHPLAVDQRSGITLARVRELAEVFMHPAGK